MEEMIKEIRKDVFEQRQDIRKMMIEVAVLKTKILFISFLFSIIFPTIISYFMRKG